MVRTVIGGLVGGLILFVMGYIFWATPLGDLAYTHAGDPQNAAIQQSLAANLTQSGTGTYIVPAHQSAEGAVLYAKGPIATIFFNTAGFSPDDMSMILPGFIMALVAGMLFAFGLAAAGAGRTFAETARIVILVSLAYTFWEFLASPVFNHFGWGYWIYGFIAESIAWIVTGLSIAWFLPRARVAAPAIVEPVAAEADPPQYGEGEHA
ncbi:MAG: hypothetical protein JWO25_2789 [Alphaproteobacteria bacterium]|nr:hypothetical protein [Alphaproteobacteria bacterium]